MAFLRGSFYYKPYSAKINRSNIARLFQCLYHWSPSGSIFAYRLLRSVIHIDSVTFSLPIHQSSFTVDHRSKTNNIRKTDKASWRNYPVKVTKSWKKTVSDGPAAYQSTLPLRSMVKAMQDSGIPSDISDTDSAKQPPLRR